MSGTAAHECDLCEVGKYNEKEGSDTCSYCDLIVKGSSTKSNGTSTADCVCEVTFYLSVETGNCVAVEEGMSTTTAFMNVTNLDLEPG